MTRVHVRRPWPDPTDSGPWVDPRRDWPATLCGKRFYQSWWMEGEVGFLPMRSFPRLGWSRDYRVVDVPSQLGPDACRSCRRAIARVFECDAPLEPRPELGPAVVVGKWPRATLVSAEIVAANRQAALLDHPGLHRVRRTLAAGERVVVSTTDPLVYEAMRERAAVFSAGYRVPFRVRAGDDFHAAAGPWFTVEDRAAARDGVPYVPRPEEPNV